MKTIKKILHLYYYTDRFNNELVQHKILFCQQIIVTHAT